MSAGRGPSEVLSLPGARIVRLDTEEPGFAIWTTVAGQSVEVATVSLDVLLRFLGPDCGFLPADWDNEGPDAKPSIVGPICVGGPYDGRRIAKSAHPLGSFLVLVSHPFELRPPHPGTETVADFSPSYSEGRYVLQSFIGPNASLGGERELWWYVGPISAGVR